LRDITKEKRSGGYYWKSFRTWFDFRKSFWRDRSWKAWNRTKRLGCFAEPRCSIVVVLAIETGEFWVWLFVWRLASWRLATNFCSCVLYVHCLFFLVIRSLYF